MKTNNSEIKKNEVHIREVYSEKALNLLKAGFAITSFSLFTYFVALLYNSFDFGLILEIIMLIFMIVSYNQIKNQNLKAAKISAIIAIFPALFLIIFDLIHLLVNIEVVAVEVFRYYFSFDQFFYYIEPYLADVLLIANVFILYKTVSALSKAESGKSTDNYVDSFYDKL